MIYYEKKVKIAATKREAIEREARADIKQLCDDLAGRINDIQKCEDVIKDVKALNNALDLYLDALTSAKDDYEDAVNELCEAKWRAEKLA